MAKRGMDLEAGPVLYWHALVQRLVWEISGVFRTLFQTGRNDISASLSDVCGADRVYRRDRGDGGEHGQEWSLSKPLACVTELRTGKKRTGELIGMIPVLAPWRRPLVIPWWLVGSLSMRFWHSVATCIPWGQGYGSHWRSV